MSYSEGNEKFEKYLSNYISRKSNLHDYKLDNYKWLASLDSFKVPKFFIFRIPLVCVFVFQSFPTIKYWMALSIYLDCLYVFSLISSRDLLFFLFKDFFNVYNTYFKVFIFVLQACWNIDGLGCWSLEMTHCTGCYWSRIGKNTIFSSENYSFVDCWSAL